MLNADKCIVYIIKYNDIVTQIQQNTHKNIISTQFFSNRKQFTNKNMNENLFDICIKIVHFIRASVIKTRRYCEINV